MRKRYQRTIAASEKTKMMVEMALISGVMPRRRRPQISSGRVLSRPIRKKLTAISSIESVKINSAAPMIDSFEIRQRYAQKCLPVVRAQIERGFFLCPVEFLQAGEDFGGCHRNQCRTVAQDDRQQAELDASPR